MSPKNMMLKPCEKSVVVKGEFDKSGTGTAENTVNSPGVQRSE